MDQTIQFCSLCQQPKATGRLIAGKCFTCSYYQQRELMQQLPRLLSKDKRQSPPKSSPRGFSPERHFPAKPLMESNSCWQSHQKVNCIKCNAVCDLRQLVRGVCEACSQMRARGTCNQRYQRVCHPREGYQQLQKSVEKNFRQISRLREQIRAGNLSPRRGNSPTRRVQVVQGKDGYYGGMSGRNWR